VSTPIAFWREGEVLFGRRFFLLFHLLPLGTCEVNFHPSIFPHAAVTRRRRKLPPSRAELPAGFGEPSVLSITPGAPFFPPPNGHLTFSQSLFNNIFLVALRCPPTWHTQVSVAPL